MTDPSERDQFHTAIYAHEPGACATCDTVRASGVFTRNGKRPMAEGTHTPVMKRKARPSRTR